MTTPFNWDDDPDLARDLADALHAEADEATVPDSYLALRKRAMAAPERRRTPLRLVAAAAVLVVGVGLGGLVLSQVLGGSASLTSSGGGAPAAAPATRAASTEAQSQPAPTSTRTDARDQRIDPPFVAASSERIGFTTADGSIECVLEPGGATCKLMEEPAWLTAVGACVDPTVPTSTGPRSSAGVALLGGKATGECSTPAFSVFPADRSGPYQQWATGSARFLQVRGQSIPILEAGRSVRLGPVTCSVSGDAEVSCEDGSTGGGFTVSLRTRTLR